VLVVDMLLCRRCVVCAAIPFRVLHVRPAVGGVVCCSSAKVASLLYLFRRKHARLSKHPNPSAGITIRQSTQRPSGSWDRPLVLPPSDRERGEIIGPTRHLLVSGSGKVVGAVTKPLKGIGNLVLGDGGESPPPDRQESISRSPAAGEERAREGEEEARKSGGLY
jgi:hypothetical protein